MTQEEKAKRYDEALIVAKQWYDDSDTTKKEKYLLKGMFPELAEPEDEKIKKELIENLKELSKMYDTLQTEEEYSKVQSWIDWVEKQGEMSKICQRYVKDGEKKPVVDTKVIIPKFRVGDIVKSKSQPMLSPRKIISIGKNCYWCEDRGCIGFAWEDDFELVEYNPSWSEEDVAMLDSAIAFVEHSPFTTIGKGKNNVIAWLKSIKDKAQTQPQPRHELSEEDKRIIDNLISQLGNLYARKLIKEGTKDKYVNWLKSLRPQNRWKPSEEQIKALNIAIRCGIQLGSWEEKALKSLEEQLKKLREE